MLTGTACYLYCLAPASRLRSVGAPAIDGREDVRVETFGEVAAVWSCVEVAEFCGESAEARLADLTWLGPRAIRQEQVIEEAMRHSPVLPATFATLFSSLESLGALIADRREVIADFFSTLGETREWSVKGRLDRTLARDRFAAARRPLDPRASPGVHYLQEKRILGEADRMVGPWVEQECRQALPNLRDAARAFRERPAPLAAPAPGIEVVFNWAFLLAPEGEAEFAHAVGRLQGNAYQLGLDYSLSGPWPPYSFAPPLIRSAQ